VVGAVDVQATRGAGALDVLELVVGDDREGGVEDLLGVAVVGGQRLPPGRAERP
jgi:hypothetical protein